MYLDWHQIPQAKGSALQDWPLLPTHISDASHKPTLFVNCSSAWWSVNWRFQRPPPTQDASYTSGLLPVLLPDWLCKSVSWTLSVGSINLLKQLTELWEPFYVLAYQFIITQEMEEMHRIGRGVEKGRASMPSPGAPQSGTSPCRLLWVCVEAPFHRNDAQLSVHGWLIQPFAALPSHEVGVGSESSNPQITWLAPPGTWPPSWGASQKSPH